jgi:glutamyl-tRNA synthetase
MAGLKARAKTLNELAESARFYVARRPLALDEKARKLMTGEARQRLAALADELKGAEWRADTLEQLVRGAAERQGAKLGSLAQPLRAALSGATVSPPVFEVMEVLGRDETLARIGDALSRAGD